jgi:hypothetical protein
LFEKEIHKTGTRCVVVGWNAEPDAGAWPDTDRLMV